MATITTTPDHPLARAVTGPDPARRLRLVLEANAVTSTVAGLAAALAPTWVADLLGVDATAMTRAVGIGLLVFAALTAAVAFGPDRRLRPGTLAVSAGDGAWVLATPVVAAAAGFSTSGWVVAVVVGLAVADFAAVQLWLRRRAA